MYVMFLCALRRLLNRLLQFRFKDSYSTYTLLLMPSSHGEESSSSSFIVYAD